MPGLKKELAGNPEACAAVMMSLEGYGLPTTAPAVNDSFDWIEGKATLTAQAYQALAHKNGYDIIPVVRNAERAVARIERPGRPPIEVEFTLDDAKRARRLDEWVERWTQQNGRNRCERFVIGVDGQRRNIDFPDWVKAQISAGQVKRFDAWWNYRTDMIWKSAAKRAVKLAAPHLLLGVTEETDHETVWEPPAPERETEPEVEFIDAELVTDPEDDDIEDAELVEDPPDSTPRPEQGPPPAQAVDATDVAAEASRPGERSAPAGEPLWGPDEEPFS
jgi:hypothetical protein